MSERKNIKSNQFRLTTYDKFADLVIILDDAASSKQATCMLVLEVDGDPSMGSAITRGEPSSRSGGDFCPVLGGGTSTTIGDIWNSDGEPGPSTKPRMVSSTL